MFFFSKNSHCDLDLGPRTLKLKIIQDIVILNICLILNQNRLINKGDRVMTKFFSKNSHCDLDLDPITLKLIFSRYCHTYYLCEVILKLDNKRGR